ncbi:MAG TPA: glycoside hydrolase family protein [Tepidisphaeraceae bacterium]|nr:glycoside hydrolase family protein [Tepidisphaeraceae bacterium]
MTLREQLIRDEGCKLRVYKDSRGIETIGVGRNLRDKGISQHEADMLLDADILEYSAAVIANLPWSLRLDEARRAVLVNMAFNLGVRGLLGFRNMLAAVEAGQYDRAADEMMDSQWAGQVGERAARLARQMQTGIWQ